MVSGLRTKGGSLGAPWAIATLLWFGTGVLAAGPTPWTAGVDSVVQKQAPTVQKPVAKDKRAPATPDATKGGLNPLFGIQITSPSAEDDVSGRIRVRAEVTAPKLEEVSSVDFFIDGRLMFSDAEAPYELLWRSGQPAEHRIEVRAYGLGREIATDSLMTRLTQPSLLGGFNARVERVEVHLRVEDEDVAQGVLDPDMFKVMENDVEQQVLAVERVADLPLAVGILVDHSESMLARLETSLEAAGAFVDGLLVHPNDKAFLLGFADIPIVFQEFTNDTTRLAEAIELIEKGDDTALYDAVISAAERFDGSDGRRAVVILTDGADYGSEHNFREAIVAAQRADIALYPVAVELSPRQARERWVLSRLAKETGGRLFSLGRRDDPREIYEAIARDLRAQYRVSYTPTVPGGAGEWRQLEIHWRAPGGDEKKVRSRPGYFAR
jgi:Ca-activated chloride channel family protein